MPSSTPSDFSDALEFRGGGDYTPEAYRALARLLLGIARRRLARMEQATASASPQADGGIHPAASIGAHKCHETG